MRIISLVVDGNIVVGSVELPNHGDERFWIDKIQNMVNFECDRNLDASKHPATPGKLVFRDGASIGISFPEYTFKPMRPTSVVVAGNEVINATRTSNHRTHSGSKYVRDIISIDGIRTKIDVYKVLQAFDVRSPGVQHAVKKLLCAGIRGKATEVQDLTESIDAINSAIRDAKHSQGTSE